MVAKSSKVKNTYTFPTLKLIVSYKKKKLKLLLGGIFEHEGIWYFGGGRVDLEK